MVADLRQHRPRARASAQRRAVLARQWRAILATLELRVTAELEIRLRGIAGLRLPLHSLEIQDRRLAGLVRL